MKLARIHQRMSKIDIVPLPHVRLKQKRRCTWQSNGIFENQNFVITGW
jgi:hypothetical protein